MTADTETACDGQPEADLAAPIAELPSGIVAICEFLSYNNKIIFKSQQIDDPELMRSEKVQIAKTIYGRNRQTFLMRFGGYFEEQHLAEFKNLAIMDARTPLKDDENGDEMKFMLIDFQQKLDTKNLNIKNRRYAAMQNLISEGEYFSEQEMMKRNPELYEELIGQYLSDAEKKQRDCYDVRNTTFSGILMHSLEHQQLEDVLKAAAVQKETTECQQLEEDEEDSTSSSSEAETYVKAKPKPAVEDNFDAEIPASYRMQWGNFDNEQTPCSSTKPTATTQVPIKGTLTKKLKKSNAPFITAGERELLRQEFIGIMHEQFLTGKDMDFDYNEVDENSQLDDLQQLNQDKEDAYFDESSDEEEVAPYKVDDSNDASEDDLDVYMSHLNQHHSLKN